MVLGINHWIEMENNFKGEPWLNFARDHTDIPVFAVALYLFIIFYTPSLIQKPIRLRVPFALWNLFLAIFSIIGAIHHIPTLIQGVHQHGLIYSCCEEPLNWYANGPAGLWLGLFIYSKIPELMDTVFLVLQKKEVLFLHWFHHITVLLYCWHAFHTRVATGLWFSTMNFTVHSVMYSYYFCMVIPHNGLRSIAKRLAIVITTMQILQMVVGMGVTAYSAYLHSSGYDCKVDPANYRLGLAMYACYFALFCKLFIDLYIFPSKRKLPPPCAVDSCGTDGAGFFHPSNSSSAPKKVQ
eukprot:NODE_4994_length_1083_cov_43.043750_g4441_i0.p1 GENE.NODE_4994_length_1083_cov_43.043750_g4441_i0~~NODE_4994_length_1083_cov_43.043750_g4441_i0.p1  ORF type:complete len:296 (+),score=29.19 NODE_4994_length_1083_cov_43.043750_g4441_i0:34-921(+)